MCSANSAFATLHHRSAVNRSLLSLCSMLFSALQVPDDHFLPNHSSFEHGHAVSAAAEHCSTVRQGAQVHTTASQVRHICVRLYFSSVTLVACYCPVCVRELSSTLAFHAHSSAHVYLHVMTTGCLPQPGSSSRLAANGMTYLWQSSKASGAAAQAYTSELYDGIVVTQCTQVLRVCPVGIHCDRDGAWRISPPVVCLN